MSLNNKRVLVTARAFGVMHPELKERLAASVGEVVYAIDKPRYTPEELAKMVPGFHGWIASLDTVTRDVFAAADQLQVITRFGVGVDNIDLSEAKEFGIAVCNTPGVNANAVAEHCVGLMIAMVRRIHDGLLQTRSGNWAVLTSPTLEGKTLGLLGFGQIGQKVAKRLAGFEMNIMAYDPFPNADLAKALGVRMVSKEELIANADILSLHLPTIDETRGSINADFFPQMKAGSFIINTARGELINEMDLFEALQRGHLSGAAMDVMDGEPPRKDHPLLALPNVIVTPHMAAYGESAMWGMGKMALENVLLYLKCEEPHSRVV